MVKSEIYELLYNVITCKFDEYSNKIPNNIYCHHISYLYEM